MGKNRSRNEEIYRRAIKNYKYNSTYNPGAELCADNSCDYYNLYKSGYASHDNKSYDTPMREYNKSTEDSKSTTTTSTNTKKNDA